MGVKASEVSGWLRQRTGKRDHREIMSDDYVVIRPGLKFHWLMGQGSPARTDPRPPAPGQTPTGDDRHRPGQDEADLHVLQEQSQGARAGT